MTTTANAIIGASWDIAAADRVSGLYDAEPHLVARIAEQVAGLKTVGPASMVDGSTVSLSKLHPLALIRPVGGSREIEGDGYGFLTISQTWAVLLQVAHVLNEQESAAYVAGPLAVGIIRAVHGWTPGDPFGPFALDGHLDQIIEPGRATFEIRFTVPVAISTP